ncbi:MAG: beta-N-acetylglucosaminidase domain-containing protein [Clostridia bacterium]|nr:beta-N-acetylglucosaminidase domain-containing protein [Clostridia bacterium]
MLFPRAKGLNKTGEYHFSSEITVELLSADGFSRDTVKTVFPVLSSDAVLTLICKKAEELKSISPEAYRIKSEKTKKGLAVTVFAPDDKALIRGLFTLKRMVMKNDFIIGEISDYPSFSVRGYIEGFYGKPWKAEERLQMLEFMALYGENTHYYAPKDDPYHRDKWRELYPENEALQLKEILNKAKSLYVDFYYCIAPGLSMCYSSEDDFTALKDKTYQLYSMGVENFGLLLDDIPLDLYYEADKKQFGNAASAQSFLVKKYYSYLKSLSPSVRLTVCPTAYHGKGDEKELVSFTGNIPEEVDVFFTGSDICSKEITSAEAEYFRKNNLHKPLYWDNYPVNDAEMFMEMHIGPIIGRDKTLGRFSAGLISNCMEYFNCNRIPLITTASYLWNSEEYDPEEAYREAVDAVIPEEEREAFMHLSDQFRTSCLHDENSRIMGEYLSRAAVARYSGDNEEFIKILENYTEIISRSASLLKGKTDPIYLELSRWIKKFILMSEILEIALSVIKGNGDREILRKKMSEYNESATVLTAFCFREYIESVLSDEN